MKPNFLVIGAMKAGTGSLYALLSQHPDIFMSNPKELHFFSSNKFHKHGWEWYESFFINAKGKQAIGEASTTYSRRDSCPSSAERIANHLPNAKLIYIVRNPLKRIESNWMHNLSRGFCSSDFKKALQENSGIIKQSCYWWQINAYRQYFSDEQIQVLFFEDFIAKPENVLAKCFHFLDVDTSFKPVDASHPRNESAKRVTENYVYSIMKRLPLWEHRKSLIPSIIRNHLRPVLIKQIERPKWDNESRQSVTGQILEDTQRFLQFYGKPVDFWNLEEEL